MKFGVVRFPGSNCDDDMIHVLGEVMGAEVVVLWHKETQLKGFTESDCIVLPGGFSYGDYLRCGAIARFSPIMDAVINFAKSGGFVLGICNGFQVLCESHLLPGVLLQNDHQKFVCKNIYLKAVSTSNPFTADLDLNKAYKIPIAHADGRYFADAKTIDELENNQQILFKYCTADGTVNQDANPNGSINNIAGICNVHRNVFGMMPHPERASEPVLGNTDGISMFASLLKNAKLVMA